MSNHRWVCPSCGAGVMASSRPRRDDVRRFCLDCSAKTGRMVERTCPALDKQRAVRTEKRAARTTSARQRAAEIELAKRSAGGIDLLAEAKRFAKLSSMRGLRAFPEITFRHSTTRPHTSGFCTYAVPARIVVTVGTDPFDAPGVVLHEMCHAVMLHDGHSQDFWNLVRRAAREAWPTASFDFAGAPNGWRTQLAIRRGLYELAQP